MGLINFVHKWVFSNQSHSFNKTLLKTPTPSVFRQYWAGGRMLNYVWLYKVESSFIAPEDNSYNGKLSLTSIEYFSRVPVKKVTSMSQS